jgi:dTDP-4-amino-4,6-dideoxygalactose transaminase
MTHAPDGPWYYQQLELGYNYRMTDIQAALGLSQLQRLDELVRRRNEIAARYAGLLDGLPLQLPVIGTDCYSAFHLYTVRVDPQRSSKGRLEVFEYLRAADIGVNVHYIPVHTQPYYRGMGFREGDFPEAESYYAQALSLPLFPDLGDQEQDYVSGKLAEVLT